MKVAVFLESYKNKITKAGLEALAAAQKISDNVTAILIGKEVTGLLSIAGSYGVKTVKKAEGDLFTAYHPNIYARAISNVEADVYVIPSTAWGKELAPLVSAKQGYGFVGDVSEVVDSTTFIRSIHGNKVLSTVKVEGNFVVAIRPGVFDLPEQGEGSPETSDISVTPEDSFNKIKLAEILAAASEKIELTEADIIVSGGRGVGGPENFNVIEDLASTLGAAVGASRAVVDAGWRPHSDQVGQTGKFVSPKLYIAAGISGAIQHLAGMSTSDVIVAVNKDPEAPIFKVADYGIVDDLFKVLPALNDAIQAARN